ncbi:MAG: DUF362 domain-containing protein [Chloroflexi bacterium]|nr:MAG: DUF362 domain-containing protein [Chloroflexota bacterium]
MSSANKAYWAVREALRLLGLDAGRFGTSAWNPLGVLVRPGDTVVLKPNFVRHFRETQAGDGDCLITHGSVIRAVLDYAYIALKGRGRLIIADAPQDDADFEIIRRIAGLSEIQQFYKQHAELDVEVYDLRLKRVRSVQGLAVGHERLSGDPAGYIAVNIGLDSAFAGINHLCSLLYGSEDDTEEVRRHHHDEIHEYLIARTVLNADCVINLPKLKTHKKTGVTLSMKNLVGINGDKNWLPHHREGIPAQGGDQFADNRWKHRLERVAVGMVKRLFPSLGLLRPLLAGPIMAAGRRVFGDTNTDTIRSGNWYGNDTAWRMVIDLNRILLYADGQGELHDVPVRRLFSIVDGIVAGEGNGPLDASAKTCGVILAGSDPVAVDLVCTRLMGFDYQRIPLLRHALEPHRYPLTGGCYEAIRCVSNRRKFHRMLVDFSGRGFEFRPHFGWRGKIEIQE